MQSPQDAELASDPCLQIQTDLSAMLDGELDPASVRRVMVHSDVCPSCRSFLAGIRTQVRLHQQAVQLQASASGTDTAAVRLREQLTVNRRKLAKILYELGRGFVLMGLSPDFSREVAREPVPVPDMAMRGRNLLDEVARDATAAAAEWVAAKDLFDGQLRSPDENLSKGQRLLSECLTLEPDTHEARIYLGLLHHVRGQRALARRQFQHVLDHASDRLMRGYALSNLGNVHLDEGDCDAAVGVLLELVESGILHDQPRLGTAIFNLAIAYGLKGQFAEAQHWFSRLHEELPHKRNLVGRELSRRSQFLHLLRTHPGARRLSEVLSTWFAVPAESPA